MAFGKKKKVMMAADAEEERAQKKKKIERQKVNILMMLGRIYIISRQWILMMDKLPNVIERQGSYWRG